MQKFVSANIIPLLVLASFTFRFRVCVLSLILILYCQRLDQPSIKVIPTVVRRIPATSIMTLLPPTFHFPSTSSPTPTPSASSSASATTSTSPLPPPGSNVLITDTAQASADFCSYGLIGAGVKGGREVSSAHAFGKAKNGRS